MPHEGGLQVYVIAPVALGRLLYLEYFCCSGHISHPLEAPSILWGFNQVLASHKDQVFPSVFGYFYFTDKLRGHSPNLSVQKSIIPAGFQLVVFS